MSSVTPSPTTPPRHRSWHNLRLAYQAFAERHEGLGGRLASFLVDVALVAMVIAVIWLCIWAAI